jgi:hypothetical protein
MLFCLDQGQHRQKDRTTTMSKPSITQASFEGSARISSDRAANPHTNGHLVSTGIYSHESLQRFFIHVSHAAINSHVCNIWFMKNDIICDVQWGRSADVTFEEHGWFRDTDVFTEICKIHPLPSGRNSEEIFIRWRDSLLDFLDDNYANNLWTRNAY